MRPRLAAMTTAAATCLTLLTGAAAAPAGARAFHTAGAAALRGSAVIVGRTLGSGSLNDGNARTTMVSCRSVGDCVAGGYYTDSSAYQQAFVVSETAGIWGKAEQIPGTAALNKGGTAQVTSVSCASPGNCVAGGFYTTASANQEAFVAGETGGRWGAAEEVPGTGTLNKAGYAAISSVSCASAGDCSAGGYYSAGMSNGFRSSQAFVVSETGGKWGIAQKVPGAQALNAANDAGVNWVSCASAGNCSAGGFYASGITSSRVRLLQAFVVSQAGGKWTAAQEVPGTAALNAGGYAAVSSVSCGSAGNCSAGGFYASSATDNIPTLQAFVVSEAGGKWTAAQEVPGTAALNAGGYAAVNSVSCGSAGNCSAGGEYLSASSATQAFVVSETRGKWTAAQEVPGTAALNKRGFAAVDSVSCAGAGSCSAGGYYQDASFNNQAFVVSEAGGKWGTAQEVPGTHRLNQGRGAAASSVSCAAAGDCSAGGYYSNSSRQSEAFVVTETGGTWRTAQEVPGMA